MSNVVSNVSIILEGYNKILFKHHVYNDTYIKTMYFNLEAKNYRCIKFCVFFCLDI